MDTKIIPRKEAKKLKLKKYFTGNPCKRGHIAERNTSLGNCTQCERERGKLRSKTELGQLSKARSERGRRTGATAARAKKRRAANPDLFSFAVAEWRKRNPEKAAAYTALRTATKMSQTPKWLNRQQKLQIAVKYAEARWMTVRTGFKHHVDHIIPLRGKAASGLHVPWNLRVIPARENIKKSNRLTQGITML